MVLVLEVGGQFAHEGLGEGCVADVVYGPDYFFGVPRGADFSVGITGREQAGQLGVALVVEAFMRLGQQPSRPKQRVGFAAPVS